MMNLPGIFGSLILLFTFNSSTCVLPVPSSAGSLRGVWTQSWRGWLLAFSHTRLCAHSNNQVQRVEQGGDERKKCIIVSCADTAQGVLQGSKGYFYGNMWHISCFPFMIWCLNKAGILTVCWPSSQFIQITKEAFFSQTQVCQDGWSQFNVPRLWSFFPGNFNCKNEGEQNLFSSPQITKILKTQ